MWMCLSIYTGGEEFIYLGFLLYSRGVRVFRSEWHRIGDISWGGRIERDIRLPAPPRLSGEGPVGGCTALRGDIYPSSGPSGPGA